MAIVYCATLQLQLQLLPLRNIQNGLVQATARSLMFAQEGKILTFQIRQALHVVVLSCSGCTLLRINDEDEFLR